MEGAGKNAPAVGAGGKHTSRPGFGSTLADTVSGGTKAPKSLNLATANAINFEAPITVTFSGPLAAVARFGAYLDGSTPERYAMRAIESLAVSELPAGFSMTDEDARKWLGVAD